MRDEWLGPLVIPGRAARTNTEATTRYRVSAERESSLSLDWTLKVDGEEPVAGCDPSRAKG